MINFKQHELIDDLFQTVKAEFPEIELVNITRSPDDSSHIWINVTVPEDEDRQIELAEFSAEKEHDILLDYGYWISVIPDKKEEP
ncbi:MAG: hypothetical protein GY795_36170 [Desulfobacterales bacterium]|nr:hypothetical protein [Desulfobacterales bacterium]